MRPCRKRQKNTAVFNPRKYRAKEINPLWSKLLMAGSGRRTREKGFRQFGV